MGKCPRCKSRYIVNGICRMCGHLVYDSGYIAPRKCAACGRTLKFLGSICYACSEAIALGAKSVAENAKAFLRGDAARAGFCPAAQHCAYLAKIFQTERAARRNARQKWWSNPENRKKAYEHKLLVHHERMATDPEYRERCRLAAERYRRKRDADPVRRERARAKGRECAARYRASEHGQAIHKAYYESHKEHLVEYQREFRQTHPEYVERMRAWSRDYYWAHREEINAQKRAKRAQVTRNAREAKEEKYVSEGQVTSVEVVDAARGATACSAPPVP